MPLIEDPVNKKNISGKKMSSKTIVMAIITLK
jgi:hypothetical protein